MSIQLFAMKEFNISSPLSTIERIDEEDISIAKTTLDNTKEMYKGKNLKVLDIYSELKER